MNFADENFELKAVQTLKGHTDRVWSLAWKPVSEGQPAVLASCSGDKTLRIWYQSPTTGSFTCKEVLDDLHTRTIRSCSWSPCGTYLATASFDATTSILNCTDDEYECVATLEGHENEVKSVAWNGPRTRIATCARDKSVWIWEVEDENQFDNLAVLQGHKQDVKMVKWHPIYDVLFSCSYDNTIKVWADNYDDDWHCVQTLKESNGGHTATVWALSFNPSGDKMVSCSDDLTIKIWGADVEKMYEDKDVPWTHLCTLSGYHDRTIFSVDWSRDGIITTGGADDAICMFVETEDGQVDKPTYKLLLKKEKAHDMDVNAVMWSTTDKKCLASASDDGTIKIWEFGPSPPHERLVSGEKLQ